jgi:nucleotide-binding universal stress UspA family protein
MNKYEKSILLAFNGAATSLPAVEYGIWLAGQIKVPLTLLGIVEKPAWRKRVEGVLEASVARLSAAGIASQAELISGNGRKIICEQAVSGRHLTLFGPFDRPVLRRWLRGRSFRRIFEEIKTPVLYVKQAHLQLHKILVCMGGLGYAATAERWALFLAQRLGAAVTLFHVVEPISYDYPTAHEIQDHWDDILGTDTPQGKNLREALKNAQDVGVPATFQVRHGNIVHEIITEVNTGNYDLVVMGSPYSTVNLRRLFMPNTTAEIAESIVCPVLVAAFGQEWIFGNSLLENLR